MKMHLWNHVQFKSIGHPDVNVIAATDTTPRRVLIDGVQTAHSIYPSLPDHIFLSGDLVLTPFITSIAMITTPTPAAMRAANKLSETWEIWHDEVPDVASQIDEATGLPELIEALRSLRDAELLPKHGATRKAILNRVDAVLAKHPKP